MGHYFSEMHGDITETERKQDKARKLARQLRAKPAACFTLDEIALILRTDWSSAQTVYYSSQCEQIFAIAARESIE